MWVALAGYLAVGSWTTRDGRSSAATLWSPDGRTWPSAPTLLPEAPSSSAGSTVVSLLGGSRGLIVSGRDGSIPDATIWWQSADGRAWHALRDYPPLGPDTGCQGEGCGLAPVGALWADGHRILGTLPGTSLVCYLSLDGGIWDPLSMTGDVPDPGPLSMTLLPGGVLATNGSTTWYGEALAG